MTDTARAASWPNSDPWAKRFLRARTQPSPATAVSLPPGTDVATYLAEHAARRCLDAILDSLRRLDHDVAVPEGMDRQHFLILLEELGNRARRLHVHLFPDWERFTADETIPVLGAGFCGDDVTTPQTCDASATGGRCDTCGEPQEPSEERPRHT